MALRMCARMFVHESYSYPAASIRQRRPVSYLSLPYLQTMQRHAVSENVSNLISHSEI